MLVVEGVIGLHQFSSVQFSRSVVSDSLRPHELQHARPPCPSPTPEFTQTQVHRVGDAIQSPHPLSSPSPPALNLSQPQGLSNESALRIRWPKYWSFRFSISPSNEHPGLISFRMDWLDLLAAQGTLKSLLQHHSSKASSLQHSAFFIIYLPSIYLIRHAQDAQLWGTTEHYITNPNLSPELQSKLTEPLIAGVLNSQSAEDWYQSPACQEWGCAVGGELWASG